MAPRIAFLFIIVSHFPYEELWRSWLEGVPSASIYFHSKNPEKVTSEWVRRNLITSSNGDIITYRPDWGSVELVRAMIALLRHALRDPDNQRFCFLSEACIPALPAAEAAALLLGAERSWIDVKFRPNNGYSALHQFSPMRCGWRVCKADQWCMLTRQHASIVVQKPHIWKHFKKVKASDEIFIPTLLHLAKALDDQGTLVCRHSIDTCLEKMGETHTQNPRVTFEAIDPQSTRMTVLSRSSKDELSTDDIMNHAIMSMNTEWPVYGEVEGRKMTYVDWSYSCLHPTTFVWNLELHRRAKERQCLFIRKVVDVKTETLQRWFRDTSQYIPSTPLVFRDNEKDRRNRLKIKHYTDSRTPYNERMWPEKDCWDYVKQRAIR